MSLRTVFEHLRLDASGAWADARRGLRFAWYRLDKGAMAVALLLGSVVLVFAFALHQVYAQQDRARERALEEERENIACLARNVYYEARGEPAEGQFAVAEVTMNRTVSGRYPDSVCAVVHEKRWDAIRKRYVGAFSWTEFYAVPEPEGEAWEFAQKVAEAVYYRREPPRVDGALYYHASYIRPSWARQKKPVTRIGRHMFYR